MSAIHLMYEAVLLFCYEVFIFLDSKLAVVRLDSSMDEILYYFELTLDQWNEMTLDDWDTMELFRIPLLPPGDFFPDENPIFATSEAQDQFRCRFNPRDPRFVVFSDAEPRGVVMTLVQGSFVAAVTMCEEFPRSTAFQRNFGLSTKSVDQAQADG